MGEGDYFLPGVGGSFDGDEPLRRDPVRGEKSGKRPVFEFPLPVRRVDSGGDEAADAAFPQRGGDPACLVQPDSHRVVEAQFRSQSRRAGEAAAGNHERVLLRRQQGRIERRIPPSQRFPEYMAEDSGDQKQRDRRNQQDFPPLPAARAAFRMQQQDGRRNQQHQQQRRREQKPGKQFFQQQNHGVSGCCLEHGSKISDMVLSSSPNGKRLPGNLKFNWPEVVRFSQDLLPSSGNARKVPPAG